MSTMRKEIENTKSILDDTASKCKEAENSKGGNLSAYVSLNSHIPKILLRFDNRGGII